jgi:hypothetical protein
VWLAVLPPADASLVRLCCSWNRSRGTACSGRGNLARPAKFIALVCGWRRHALDRGRPGPKRPRVAMYACERSSYICFEGRVSLRLASHRQRERALHLR